MSKGIKLTPEEKKTKFLTEIVAVMQKNKVKDVVIIYGLNQQLNNTGLSIGEENKLYSNISDGINEFLKQFG